MKFLALQPLTITHLPEAVELDQRCLGGLWTKAGYQREIDSPNSDLLVLQSVDAPGLSEGSLDNGKPLIGLACTWAIADEAHITLLAVDPAYRKQGLGQLLLYTLLVLAWRRGLEWATLEVRISNQTAIALYQKFGFEAVGQRRSYYQDTGEDALILWRKGLQRPEFQVALQQWRQQVSQRLQQAGWHLSAFPDTDWYPSQVKFSPAS
ncbi:ribosomal protein S18-alanine N-acetyltransferase [Leptolyngbya sp. NK1-12]|uniref:Ribosomal protein S18-alanine N-acetyltransferase n=1 Tax=Leptolyngbya sp. NK1-12 TaxID=2547451 RepID=A0AA96WIK0_9CYAN|nr:ribosomal protein S18-alanine N-acetyltransferase [Leptolyngbya sp. NK1-12]WNZ26213.1 ribosomal protein S18-alanine N-acetyltransferase [Leptolyngbya sp. NK1-12]